MSFEKNDLPHAEERFERYLDGGLEPSEARRFEGRMTSDPELARRLQEERALRAALRRRFPVPSVRELEARVLGPALARTAAGERPGRARPLKIGPARSPLAWWLPSLIALAAATILVWVLARIPGARTPGELSPPTGPMAGIETGDAAVAPVSASDRPSGDSSVDGVDPDGRSVVPSLPVGPRFVIDPTREASDVTSADLATLYEQAVASTQRGSMVCGTGDELDERLTESYGKEVRLARGAEQRLQGPFSSEEWPTGTVLTGYFDEQAAVVVAEREDMLQCCVEVELAEESGLNLFVETINGIAFAEITPLAEPHFLQLFERGDLR